jgi:hypothetical protein
VTTKALHRVQAAVDAVAGQIIPAVRRTAPGVGVLLDGGLDFNPDAMAVAAKTGTMAHLAHRLTVQGRKAMLPVERSAMLEALKRKISPVPMTAGASAQIFACIGVAQRDLPALNGDMPDSRPYCRQSHNHHRQTFNVHVHRLKAEH